MQRRDFLAASTAAITLTTATAASTIFSEDPKKDATPAKGRVITRRRLKQSLCRWCYSGIELKELCKQAAEIGFSSVELLDAPDWKVPHEFGLLCALGNGPGPIHKGWNKREHHANLLKETERLLPLAAEAKVPNVIVFSGNRGGISEADGIENCVIGLKQAAALAEKHQVTLVLEYLNSKVDHGDYQFDHMAFGVAVLKAVGSERLKLLYDIYHAQIMEGDVIRTIRDNKQWIGHYHTGGVPGRGEIDETQELNYKAICSAIVESGFQGHLSQEFCPTRDPLTSLRQAAAICDV